MKKLVAFGRSISAESGIKTFRSYNGLWENRGLKMSFREGFARIPKLVLDFITPEENS